MLLPAKLEGKTEISPVESTMVASWEVDQKTNNLIMHTLDGTFIANPDQLDDYWWETYQLIFDFDWEEKEKVWTADDFPGNEDAELKATEMNIFEENYGLNKPKRRNTDDQ